MTTPLPPRTALPSALPDQRTAERLMDIVDQLARALQQPRARNHHASQADDATLLALQTENAQLKARQAAAKARLEALLAKIQTMPSNTHDNESQAA